MHSDEHEQLLRFGAVCHQWVSLNFKSKNEFMHIGKVLLNMPCGFCLVKGLLIYAPCTCI